MPSEQFSQPVSGGGGQPVATSTAGTVETDNYPHGDAFEHDGTAYPYTVNPAATIQELTIIESGDMYARITTTGGDTFDLPLRGGHGVWDKWEIDEVEFVDPDGTGAAIAGGWAGE